MVSDSPYTAGALVLPPRAGIAGGVVGALAMLALIAVLQPISPIELTDMLTQIGGVFLPIPMLSAMAIPPWWTGLMLHVVLGALFGLLYAACQQRTPTHGLISVGLFYGFVLWLVGSLLAGSLLGTTLRDTIRSWPWLFACLLYGLCLAATAIWVESRRAAGPTLALPLD
jgi:hypothetical protein